MWRGWSNPILTFSQTLWTVHSWNVAQRCFVARPFRPYQFEWPSLKVTLTRADGKSWKRWLFSDTIITTVMQARTVVVCGSSYQDIPVSVTFIQGHRSWWKSWKIYNIGIFSYIINACSHERWQDGIPWEGILEHTNLGDLYPRSRSLEQVEIPDNTITVIFLDTMTTTVCQTISYWMTFSQGQGHNFQPRSRS